MLSVSSLIEFLLNLLRDEAAQAEFERDPHGVLARHGLDGLSGQDVRDAHPIVADHVAVHVKDDDHDPVSWYHRADDDHDDAVREISYIHRHYEVDRTVVVNDSDEYNVTYVDDRDTIVNVDDRDTTTIVADGDVTIEDSFNQDNDVTAIEDSFNQDNDGVDNKGGTIDDSAVAGDDIEDSYNSDDDVSVNESYNSDHSETSVDASDDDTTEVDVEDSYNSDDDAIESDVTAAA